MRALETLLRASAAGGSLRMKPFALLCAALLCLAPGTARAQAKEKRPAGKAAVKSCDPADLEGCTAWAERVLAADPGDQTFEAERKEAQARLRAACAGNVLHSCSVLADALERFAVNRPDDALKLVTLRTRTCANGDLRDCEKLGRDLLERRGVTSPRDAAAALRRACDGKRPAACLRLAALLDSGDLGAPDSSASLVLRERACELGDAGACASAGDALGRGLTSRDRAKVRTLDDKACALGRGATCLALFRAEQAAVKVEKVPAPGPLSDKALDYLRRGCDVGDGNSCWELSRLTAGGGAGGPRDDDKAVDLMLLGCAQGKGGPVCRDASVSSLRALLPPPPAPPPAPPRLHNWLPTLVAAGVTALAGGAGVQQALQSQSGASDLRANPSLDSVDKRRGIDDANRRSRVLYAAAGALAAVTVTFYFVF
jgi:TPR repeat protein